MRVIVHRTRTFTLLGNGRPAGRITVQPGTYEARRVPNPTAHSDQEWLAFEYKGMTVGGAEAALRFTPGHHLESPEITIEE